MKRDGKPVSARGAARVGVLDAGVVLARLERGHRAHKKSVDLFVRGRESAVSLAVSVVNLAEALQHSRRYCEATGLDLVTFLHAYGVRVHTPDVQVARRAAVFSHFEDASLADRFAVATAEVLGARLYTTDTDLAAVLVRQRFPCTLF
jgi:predicted nucleic acid-binding protein